MKSGTAILVTFLICLVAVALYWFLGKSQMTKQINEQKAELAVLDTKLEEIRQKEQEIAALTQQLPVWRRQVMLFKSSIPEEVDDHVFFGNLARELERYPEVSLLSVESNFGGAWLGEIKEKEKEELTSLGINPNVAAGIRVVFYSIKLHGDFDQILNVFENLKKNRRLYTVDLIAGPAAGGSGTISVNNQPESTPIQFSGRLYYSLQDPALSIEHLEEMFFDALAARIHRQLVESGADAIDGTDESAAPAPAAGGSGASNGAGEIETETQAGDEAGQDDAAVDPADAWQALQDSTELKAVAATGTAQEQEGS